MEKFDWLASFRKGHTNLVDAIGFYLAETAAPADLRAAYEQALITYLDGDASDLAEPFGIALSKRQKNAVSKELNDRLIYETVEALAEGWKVAVVRDRQQVDERTEKKIPKKTLDYPSTVFDKAAELLTDTKGTVGGMTPETVKRYYYRIRKSLEK